MWFGRAILKKISQTRVRLALHVWDARKIPGNIVEFRHVILSGWKINHPDLTDAFAQTARGHSRAGATLTKKRSGGCRTMIEKQAGMARAWVMCKV